MATLVKFVADWADEFTLEEFIVLDEKMQEVEEKVQKLLQCKYMLYFGTNEGFEPGSLERGDFIVMPIPPSDRRILQKYFPDEYLGAGFLSSLADPDFGREDPEEDEE